MGKTRAVFALAALLAGGGSAGATDPAVPAGVDPGGTAVAIIGPGVDYTDQQIAGRLARDGEGQLIGYDLVDDDARPMEPGAGAAPVDGGGLCLPVCYGTASAQVIAATPGASVAIFRIALPQLAAGSTGASAEPHSAHAHRGSLARAIGMVSKSPARIALLVLPQDIEPDWELVRTAASRFPHLLFVVPSVGGTAGPSAMANVLAVTAQEQVVETTTADIILPVALSAAESRALALFCDWGCGPAAVSPVRVNRAATLVAARAAELLASAPEEASGALKQRLVALWRSGQWQPAAKN